MTSGIGVAAHIEWMKYDAYFELTEKTGWRVTDIDWASLAADAAA